MIGPKPKSGAGVLILSLPPKLLISILARILPLLQVTVNVETTRPQSLFKSRLQTRHHLLPIPPTADKRAPLSGNDSAADFGYTCEHTINDFEL